MKPEDQNTGQAAPDPMNNFNAMARMAGAVAHDFNNILTGILGNLELLERRAAKLGATDFIDYLKGARSAANRGVELNRRLLSVSGHQALEPEALALPALMEDVAPLLRTRLGGAVHLHIDLPATLWPVFCDPAPLAEALLALAANAREAMQGGGQARLTGRNINLAPPAAAAMSLAAGDYVALSLRDSGPGMSNDVAARAFEPFFTTRSNGAGSGLGLAAVLGFMRQSGGHAQIEQTAPGETVVTLYFPRRH
jgi:signal transduction histidine kinase